MLARRDVVSLSYINNNTNNNIPIEKQKLLLLLFFFQKNKKSPHKTLDGKTNSPCDPTYPTLAHIHTLPKTHRTPNESSPVLEPPFIPPKPSSKQKTKSPNASKSSLTPPPNLAFSSRSTQAGGKSQIPSPRRPTIYVDRIETRLFKPSIASLRINNGKIRI